MQSALLIVVAVCTDSPIGQAVLQTLHILHASDSRLRYTGLSLPNRPLAAPNGQAYRHQGRSTKNDPSKVIFA
jgi:hypothetical protein